MTDREILCSALSSVEKTYTLLLVTWLLSLFIATILFRNILICACSTYIYICAGININMCRYTVYIIAFVNSK